MSFFLALQFNLNRVTTIPCDFFFGSTSEEPKEVIDYVDDLKEKLLNIHERVRHKIRVARDSVGLQARDLKWLYNPRRRKGCCPKLSLDWEGSYTVMARTNDVVYRIRRGPKTKMKIIHLDRLMNKGLTTIYQVRNSGAREREDALA
ncbi:hypothetical protein Zmor_017568 [Zophobas morio]|uniref:Integrase p58-like C-terminal domain-containing protein n=1 Tax=Zophobas morio TaxID=2755281 RepID=A0AA38MCP9_9CUCU|nr:hypothetical protein Zmor_017568 [Zophobas morio]